MDETTYQQRADATLARLAEALEPAYDRGEIDELERDGSVLTITTASGRTLVVSKHAPSKQIWLASRTSGGLHFAYAASGEWQLPDGSTLPVILTAELAAEKVSVTL